MFCWASRPSIAGITSLSSPIGSRQSGARSSSRAAKAHASTAGAAGGGSAATAEAQPRADVTRLSPKELHDMLSLRRLSTEGSLEEQQARLAAFLADPSAFPDAARRPRRVVLLGGRLFAAMQQLRSHIRLLMQLLAGEEEVVPGHPDFLFLRALLEQHPRYSEKVQPPVAAFRVRAVVEEDMAPILCFEFRDSRGTWDDFSYRKCIGIPPSYNYAITFRDAMRFAIRDQLKAFRLASAKKGRRGESVWKCDCCGRRTSEVRQMRVEHEEPAFGQLIASFCETTSLQPPPVDTLVPGSKRRCFSDVQWVTEWQRYHRRNCRRMQLVCMRCIMERQQQRRDAPDASSGDEAAPVPAPE